jgi:RHS repeat-associated protein
LAPSGTGNVEVKATDPSGNVRTNIYQVTQTGAGKSFTFDANGSMTSDGTRTYVWDAENRLVEVRQDTTTLASFAYNKDGIRTRKTAGGATTTYVLDGASVVEERLSGGGTIKHLHGRGIDHVLATIDVSGGVSYYVRDHLGSICHRTDAAGQPTVARDYGPWGNLVTGGSAGGWAFTGRDWDPEVALAYYRTRYYDPNAGRFLSEDPIRFGGGPNLFAYVGSNVVRWIDPLGFGAAAPTPPPSTIGPPSPPLPHTECYFSCLFDFGPGGGTLALIFLCVPAGLATAEIAGLLGGACAVLVALYCDHVCKKCKEHRPPQPHGGEVEPPQVAPPQPNIWPPVRR